MDQDATYHGVVVGSDAVHQVQNSHVQRLDGFRLAERREGGEKDRRITWSEQRHFDPDQTELSLADCIRYFQKKRVCVCTLWLQMFIDQNWTMM